MKIFKIIILAFISFLSFIACSGGDDNGGDVVITGETFQQSTSLPATQADQTITLSDLKTAISSIKGGKSWLTVLKENYTSGSPNVRLKAEDNKDENPRNCEVTITAESGDKVILTVKQEGGVKNQTFSQSVTLPAAKADSIITLSDLKTAIISIEGGESWLTVSKENYTSGSPNVRLKAEDNKNENPRNCELTITAESGDKVILKVEQEKAEPKKTGIDDSHDVPTDQPAYGREF